MSDFLTSFLATILKCEGCPNHEAVAKKAAEDLRKAKIVDPMAVKRAQILADPCRDWKVIKRRYQAGRTFIYKCWG